MKKKFVICIDNDNYEVSLEKGKVYQVISDTNDDQKNFVRIVDESGEDYLFPKENFVPIHLPEEAEKALVA